MKSGGLFSQWLCQISVGQISIKHGYSVVSLELPVTTLHNSTAIT